MSTPQTMDEMQEALFKWSTHNFGDRKGLESAKNCTLGVCEEAGELAHSILKWSQGVRTNEDHEAKAKNAVGDVVIYLFDLCSRMDWVLSECIHEVYEEITQRDWKKYPETGLPPDEPTILPHPAITTAAVNSEVYGD